MAKTKPLQPEFFELETNTVWSFPNRGNWATHDAKYRGNWSPYIPRNIILRYSHEGDTVLDQFVGGGTTAVEAKLTHRNFIGFDINPEAVSLSLSKCDFQFDTPCTIKINQGDISTIKLDILELNNIISEINIDSSILYHIKQDIVDLSKSLNTIKSKLSDIDNNKKNINNILTKQDRQSKEIDEIKDNIILLKTEDNHIFEIISDLQNELDKVNDNNNIIESIALI